MSNPNKKSKKPESCIAGLSKRPTGIHRIPDHRRSMACKNSSNKYVLLSPKKPLTPGGRKLRYCQDGVSGKLGDRTTPLSSLAHNLHKHGWLQNEKGEYIEPMSIVKMPDGSYCSLDHRRAVAAVASKSSRIFATIFQWDTPLPPSEIRRFKLWHIKKRQPDFLDAVESRLKGNVYVKTPTERLPHVRDAAERIALFSPPRKLTF